MTRTHEKVRYAPRGKVDTTGWSDAEIAECVAHSVRSVESALAVLEGRWKMMILFNLFARPVMRFSELERAIPAISQKMLAQQLRDFERSGMVKRTVHPEVPPKVEYSLTDLGQALCPALDELVRWQELRSPSQAERPEPTAQAKEVT
jgi:DNA-binding HxlR family transcriptional regulator